MVIISRQMTIALSCRQAPAAEEKLHPGGNVSAAFFVLGILSALWAVVDAILIAVALDKRGIRVNTLLFRVFFFRYLRQYRSATVGETGRVGSLYYSYISAINVALVCAVVGLLLRAR